MYSLIGFARLCWVLSIILRIWLMSLFVWLLIALEYVGLMQKLMPRLRVASRALSILI